MNKEFTLKQFELTAEFGKFVFEHPDVDEWLPDGAFVYFQMEGEPEFNQFSWELAERQQREEGVPAVLVRVVLVRVVLVRVKGLALPLGSRLIDPVIEPVPAVA